MISEVYFFNYIIIIFCLESVRAGGRLVLWAPCEPFMSFLCGVYIAQTVRDGKMIFDRYGYIIIRYMIRCGRQNGIWKEFLIWLFNGGNFNFNGNWNKAIPSQIYRCIVINKYNSYFSGCLLHRTIHCDYNTTTTHLWIFIQLLLMTGDYK